ncbi:MAG: LacI family DNA-binding transcriptional regulator [Anaerolineae bacterium]|jgi:LacI family transcriptional regulator|nr:LacI family DNA-binding transcriptional regulator [Anaerolineae bacterium]
MVVTIKDIAKETGKSVTTVSRALNNHDDVSSATTELVHSVAKKLGYTPNIFAQRLQKQFTDTIGLIIPTFGPRFSDPFFSEFLAGVGNRAAHLGYDLLVSTRAPGDDEIKAYCAMAQGKRVDGFVLVRTRKKDARVECLQKNDYPFVAFGRAEENNDFPYVDEDGAYGMRLITEHLISLGHRRIAYISPPPELMFAQYRLQGFEAGLAQAGIRTDDSLFCIGDLTQRGGYEQACALLDLPSPPTAIAASNDLMAFGAMSAAQKRGLVIGKDISITGFDNIPMAEHTHPPLTTLHQPLYQIGGMVCEMLIHLVRGEELEKKNILLKPELIVRQSAGLLGS